MCLQNLFAKDFAWGEKMTYMRYATVACMWGVKTINNSTNLTECSSTSNHIFVHFSRPCLSQSCFTHFHFVGLPHKCCQRDTAKSAFYETLLSFHFIGHLFCIIIASLHIYCALLLFHNLKQSTKLWSSSDNFSALHMLLFILFRAHFFQPICLNNPQFLLF